MIHKQNCDCINCEAKGKPVREIWLKNVTVEDIVKIEVYDWVEGYGMISSLAERTFIRRYGLLLLKLQKRNDMMWASVITDQQKEDKMVGEIDALKLERSKDWDQIRMLEAANRVLKVENQRLADLQKQLQQEQKANIGSFIEIETLSADVERLTIKVENYRMAWRRAQTKIKQLKNTLVNVQLNDGGVRAGLHREIYSLKGKLSLSAERIKILEVQLNAVVKNGNNAVVEQGRLKKLLEMEIVNREIAIEQRVTDWQRIRVNKLETEMGELKEVIQKLVKQIP